MDVILEYFVASEFLVLFHLEFSLILTGVDVGLGGINIL